MLERVKAAKLEAALKKERKDNLLLGGSDVLVIGGDSQSQADRQSDEQEIGG